MTAYPASQASPNPPLKGLPPRGPLLMVVISLFVGSGLATAQQETDEGAAPLAATSGAPSPDAPLGGVRAFVDPATGAITATPTAGQLAALQALERRAATVRNKSAIGLVATPVATGGFGVDLQGRFVSSAIADPFDPSRQEPLALVCTDRDPERRHAEASPFEANDPKSGPKRTGGPVPDLPSAEQ